MTSMKLEAKARLSATMVTAGKVTGVQVSKFLDKLFKDAGLKKLGMSKSPSGIRSTLESTPEQVQQIRDALKAQGFTKPFTHDEGKGLAHSDGSWPLIITETPRRDKIDLEIYSTGYDNLAEDDEGDANAMRDAVHAAAKALGLSVGEETHDEEEYEATVRPGEFPSTDDILKKLKKLGYKTLSQKPLARSSLLRLPIRGKHTLFIEVQWSPVKKTFTAIKLSCMLE